MATDTNDILDRQPPERPARVFDFNEVSKNTMPGIGPSADGADARKPESVGVKAIMNAPQPDNTGPTTNGGSGGMADMGKGF